MNLPANPSSTRGRLGWGLITALLLLQFASRYLPSPEAVWVVDDWANAARSSFYASTLEAAATGLQDPNRPLSMMAVEVGYRLFGDRAWIWTLVSLVANSLLLLALMKMALELTGRREIAFAAGAVFALLPNLTETYHWSTQVLNEVSCGLVPYALSGWLGVAYFRRGGGWRLALSALAYGVGLFSYEAGILLPGAFLALVPWRRKPIKGLLCLAPFALVCSVYAAWRGTNAFGLNHVWNYPPHMQAGASLAGMRWGFHEVANWWLGNHMAAAVRSGLKSFATLSAGVKYALAAIDVAAIFLLGRSLRRLSAAEEEKPPGDLFSGAQPALFAAAWTAAAAAISVVSYSAPRLNVLPAMGISLLAALALRRLSLKIWTPVLLIPAVLAMASNQGTAESYRRAGRWNQEIFVYLRQHADEWRGKKILLFDTTSWRRSLPVPSAIDPDAWANNGNAPLARGFSFIGMAQLATGQKNSDLLVLHDVEYGTRIDGAWLFWHNRFNPARNHTNSMADVFVVAGPEFGSSGE